MTGRARAVSGPANSCGNLDCIVDLDATVTDGARQDVAC
jgi:hypothetical protein